MTNPPSMQVTKSTTDITKVSRKQLFVRRLWLANENRPPHPGPNYNTNKSWLTQIVINQSNETFHENYNIPFPSVSLIATRIASIRDGNLPSRRPEWQPPTKSASRQKHTKILYKTKNDKQAKRMNRILTRNKAMECKNLSKGLIHNSGDSKDFRKKNIFE